MTFDHEKVLDDVGWQILQLLQHDARMSYREIGDNVGLTPPAVTERIRRMEEAGIINGYYADVNLDKTGRSVMAFVHLTNNAEQSMRFREVVDDIPEILECHCITGSESYILKVAVTNVPHLEAFLLDIKEYGEVRTSLVLSVQLDRRIVNRPEPYIP